MARVRELAAGFDQAPGDVTRWKALLEAIEGAEEACFALAEGDGAAALGDAGTAAVDQALDELTILRDEVVRRDPQAGSR